MPLAVAGATFCAFIPAIDNQFVNWDDDKVLLEQYGYRGFSPVHLSWMFNSVVMGHYQPITWLTYALDYAIYDGLDPRGFHLTNILFHSANAMLFYFLALSLLRLTLCGRRHKPDLALYIAAVLAALFFGVHPLRTESVAWVTERRDVVSTFFLLTSVLLYGRYVADRDAGKGWYTASVLALVLSLMSKAWGITLPLVLLIMDVYPYRRITWGADSPWRQQAKKACLDKIPYALPALWVAYVSLQAQSVGQVMKSVSEYGWPERIGQSCFGLVFYLVKTVVPSKLAPIYEIPVEMNPLAVRFLLAGLLVVVVTVGLIAMRKRWPFGLASWLICAVVLSPVLGIAQSGPQLAADRYSYISCMPWALLAAALVLRLMRTQLAMIAILGSLAAIVGLAGASWQQCKTWRTSQTLWEHTLSLYPESWNAHVNLGSALQPGGEHRAALKHFDAALAIKPGIPAAHANAAQSFLALGQTAEALNRADLALGLSDTEGDVLRNLGSLYFKLGKHEQSAEVNRRALRLRPDDVILHANQAAVTHELGDLDQAILHLRKVVQLVERFGKISPQNAQAYVNACRTLRDIYERRGDLIASDKYSQRIEAQAR